MQSAARLGRAALPVVAGGVAAVTSAGPAHADAQPAELPIATRSIADAWEFADFSKDSKDKVLFSPADIDSAVNMLTRPSHPHSAAIEELTDSSDCSSDGAVDEVIERNSFLVSQHSQEGDADAITSYGFDASLFSVAARLLKSPGVQREIVQAALSDPEVFDILAGKMDLPGYLGSQGLAARGLLPPSSSATAQDGVSAGGSSSAVRIHEGDDDDAASSNILEELSGWVADTVEGMGYAVVRLGRWMRNKLLGEQQQDQEAAAASAGSGDRAFRRRVGGGTIAAVMVAMVAIIAVVLLKKPVVLRRVARSVRVRQ